MLYGEGNHRFYATRSVTGKDNQEGGKGGIKSDSVVYTPANFEIIFYKVKSSMSPPRGPASAAVLPPSVGLCPLENMALQCGYDLTPIPSSIVYIWGGSANFPARLPLPNADSEVIQVRKQYQEVKEYF